MTILCVIHDPSMFLLNNFGEPKSGGAVAPPVPTPLHDFMIDFKLVQLIFMLIAIKQLECQACNAYVCLIFCRHILYG